MRCERINKLTCGSWQEADALIWTSLVSCLWYLRFQLPYLETKHSKYSNFYEKSPSVSTSISRTKYSKYSNFYEKITFTINLYIWRNIPNLWKIIEKFMKNRRFNMTSMCKKQNIQILWKFYENLWKIDGIVKLVKSLIN